MVKDKFDISDGNKLVLETIPKMMCDAEYRKTLRLLVMKFLFESVNKKILNIRYEALVKKLK